MGEVTPSSDTSSSELRVRGLSKTYPGTRALRSFDLLVRPGSIHAVVGANGSGKSTLVKILAGVERADPGGEISIGSDVVAGDQMTPEAAHRLGLRFVHQEIGVFDDLSVAENVAMATGFGTRSLGRIPWKRLRSEADRLIEEYEIGATPTTPVCDLRPASRMMLAIARALGADGSTDGGRARLLVLDEPTAALPEHEAELLAERLRRFAQRGTSILFISHHLREVLQLSDEVTALRDGVLVDTTPAAGLTEARLVELIVGRTIDEVFPTPPPSAPGDEVLRVEGLAAGPLRGVDLSVTRGEIVGIAGLLGSGRSTLLRSLFGCQPTRAGRVWYQGKQLHLQSPKQAIAQGVAYVPEDRPNDGLLGDLSIRENVVAPSVSEFWLRGRMATRSERAATVREIDRLGVRATGPEQMISALSGGNQQKVILSRWLRRNPWLLLLDEPSHGVDVGARADIYRALRNAADAGAAVLVVASDFGELASACDRVLILRGGVICGEHRPPMNADELTVQAYLDVEPSSPARESSNIQEGAA